MTRRTAKRSRGWSYSAGHWGTNRVRVHERPDRGTMVLEYYEKEGDGRFRKKRDSLGNVSREAAMMKADQAAAALRAVGRSPAPTPLTVATLFDKYLAEVTPTKARLTGLHDTTCAALMKRSFGPKRVVSTLGRLEWDAFIRKRRSGALRPRNGQKGGVRDRQIQYDLKFALAVCNWALTVKDSQGQPLLERNPFKGLPVPREESPRRPELSDVEYMAMLNASHVVNPQFRLALILTHETGHRISSVRQLRWSDLDLKAATVRWRAETDKIGFDGTTPLTPAAVQALEAYRGRRAAIGEVWVFPAHFKKDKGKPTSRYTLAKWWTAVEQEAKLAPCPRRQFHSLRRKFATEMKGAPLRDLAYLGGWKSVTTVVEVYQRPDAETMKHALAMRRPVGATVADAPELGTTIRLQETGT